MNRRILIVDDSALTCRQISNRLDSEDRTIKTASDGEAGLEYLIKGNFSLVIAALELPKLGGLDLIREVRSRGLPVSIIAMTERASIPTAVAAMQLGAYDYLEKPLDLPRLESLVEQALADRRLEDEVRELREGLRRKYSFHNLLGRGARMREVFDRVARVASADCPVLITGETGTGKELAAQALHYANATRQGPLITVNCAALPEPLLESELFGHERGAFTGADRRKLGRFERAKSGTLLLDEIGEVPFGMQAKLLRVLQEGRFERVGGTESIRTDCRIIAATNVDLSRSVASGRFREDLFYRLNVVSVELPPLRERDPENVPLLVEHFLEKFRDRGLPHRTFSREALARLARYDWPGNVRELEHVVEQLIVTTPGPVIDIDALPAHVAPADGADEVFRLDYDLDRPLAAITESLTAKIERAYLSRVLEKFEGRIALSAEHCGLSRRSISEKLRRYRIDKSEFKPRSARPRVAVGGA